MEDASAPHFISISYALKPDEVAYIAEGVERFSLNEGGQAYLFFNSITPIVSPSRNTVQCLLCDFRGGEGVRKLLNDFLAEEASTPLSTGISWDDVRAVAVQVPELTMTAQVEQQILRILNENPLEDTL